MPSLTRIVPWSQQLACEVLQPGDLAVDLTAGKGRDTAVLADAVGPQGQVVAFDLQGSALEETRKLLLCRGHVVSICSSEQPVPAQPGVSLVQACHSRLGEFVQRPVKAIMANLGYLPGGDLTLVTRPDTTLSALQQALTLLAPGGRLAVTVYPAHSGGHEEGSVVEGLLSQLPGDLWQVLSQRVANCQQAPFLYVAERLS